MTCNKYIIDDEVIFIVNENILESASGLGERVILNLPTTRCLQLLLERSKDIVSREEFLETVWRTRGIVVSQNTFYQNISLLRKSLKVAGLTRDIIKTERRKGFSLMPGVSIKAIDQDANVHSIDNSIGDYSHATYLSQKEHPQTKDISTEGKKAKRSYVFKMNFWWGIIIVLLFFLEVINLILRL